MGSLFFYFSHSPSILLTDKASGWFRAVISAEMQTHLMPFLFLSWFCVLTSYFVFSTLFIIFNNVSIYLSQSSGTTSIFGSRVETMKWPPPNFASRKIQGGPKNTDCFWVDNFVTVSGRKVCDISEASKFCLEMCIKRCQSSYLLTQSPTLSLGQKKCFSLWNLKICLGQCYATAFNINRFLNSIAKDVKPANKHRKPHRFVVELI